MADAADRADANTPPTLEAEVARARRLAADMPYGAPGECAYCGEQSPRLVGRLCADCRTDWDMRRLPPWK